MEIYLTKTNCILLVLFLVYLCTKETAATCNFLEVDDSDENKKLNGEYIRNNNCQQPDGPGAPLYTKQRDSSEEDSDEHHKDDIYLYYVYNHDWKGWVFGLEKCGTKMNEIYAYVASTASNPEDINGNWAVKDGNRWKYDDIEIKCEEDESSQALVLLIALLCTACILLIALFPAIWIYYTKKRDQHATRTHPQVQSPNNARPAAMQSPPPYSEEPTVFTIQPGNNSTGASSTIPSYVHDMTHINHKRKDLTLPPPPVYQSLATDKPPAYKENSTNEMTEDDNNIYDMIEMSDYTASAPPPPVELPPDAELPAYTDVANDNNSNNNGRARNRREVARTVHSPSCSAW